MVQPVLSIATFVQWPRPGCFCNKIDKKWRRKHVVRCSSLRTTKTHGVSALLLSRARTSSHGFDEKRNLPRLWNGCWNLLRTAWSGRGSPKWQRGNLVGSPEFSSGGLGSLTLY
jgi:hypothetical protein